MYPNDWYIQKCKKRCTKMLLDRTPTSLFNKYVNNANSLNNWRDNRQKTNILKVVKKSRHKKYCNIYYSQVMTNVFSIEICQMLRWAEISYNKEYSCEISQVSFKLALTVSTLLKSVLLQDPSRTKRSRFYGKNVVTHGRILSQWIHMCKYLG